jgi:hypothetical protein
MTTINNGFDHGGIHPQSDLPPIPQEHLAGNAQGRSRPSAEVTEYVIKEIGLHQWLVLADRQSIALCANENEAVKVMTEHSARGSRSGTSSVDNWSEQDDLPM